jgi:hypothetical protein
VAPQDQESVEEVGRAAGLEHGFAGSASAELVTAAGTHMSIWHLDSTTWPDVACRLAGRNLTREEWAGFGPTTIGYRATCDQYPADTA